MLVFIFKQVTAYEMRISDWSSYVCSSDLNHEFLVSQRQRRPDLMYTRTPSLDFGSRSPSAFAGCKYGANGVAMSLVRIRPGGERCQQPGRVLSRRATMQSAISLSFSLRRQRLGPSAGNYDDAWAERLAPVQAIAGEPGHSRKVSYENPHLGRYISTSKHVNSQPILHCPYFTFLGLTLRSRRINAIERSEEHTSELQSLMRKSNAV